MLKAIIAISLAAYVAATCDNACSGHGVCECGFCQCYDNWAMGYDLETGDCSDRVCPFEFAWVDAPNAAGKYHKYAECAGRGLCNRVSGECECFEGYEGKACQRTTCPNDCSGHGTCEYIENLGFGFTPFTGTTAQFVQDASLTDYKGWDRSKTRGCVCDPEYGDVDCSKRLCPYGNDMMDRHLMVYIDPVFQKQSIVFKNPTIADLNGKTFGLTFRSKMNETFTTIPIVFNTNTGTFQTAIENALLRLPNRVIDKINVVATANTGVSPQTMTVVVEFIGDYVEGQQHLLVVEDYKCGEGCTPMLDGLNTGTTPQIISETQAADYNSYECGRRGKCDYETGLCQCFEGFTGPSCNACTALI